MDIENIIKAAEHCIKGRYCAGCVFEKVGNCKLHYKADIYVTSVKSHYESLLAEERSKVIAEVREWLELNEVEMYNPRRQNAVLSIDLQLKLDSMDADKYGGEK